MSDISPDRPIEKEDVRMKKMRSRSKSEPYSCVCPGCAAYMLWGDSLSDFGFSGWYCLDCNLQILYV